MSESPSATPAGPAMDDSDARSSRELVQAYRAALETDDFCRALMAPVHRRGGAEELALGAECVRSFDPLDRQTGAYLLGQLGTRDRTFLAESLDLLLPLLREMDEEVLEEALYALGHRREPGVLPEILRFRSHRSPRIRLAVVSALSTSEDPRAIEALIVLSADPDSEVRDWATFGLGSRIETDTPAIREALAARLTEEDAEIRGEALVGLARCRDPRAFGALAAELSGPFWGSWCLEAAERLARPELCPLLERLRARAPEEDRMKFAADFDRALAACGSGDR